MIYIFRLGGMDPGTDTGAGTETELFCSNKRVYYRAHSLTLNIMHWQEMI